MILPGQEGFQERTPTFTHRRLKLAISQTIYLDQQYTGRLSSVGTNSQTKPSYRPLAAIKPPQRLTNFCFYL
ncbi:hypothetical protein [Terrimicrobium sacchariphilum]|uniref:hypothetical protein n=1 Tax=Terrimicrobium sacchariphilum TaxID=690879 RepID=UPI0014713CAB|nr:hypothetical protein [Terrimicrobium sacchariphilum]